MFHGIGVLCSAISEGLKRAALPHYQSVAIEIEEKYFNASIANNPIWKEKTDHPQYMMCMPAQDVDLSKGAVKSEINSGGIPCQGSSLSGRAKNGNKSAEAHSKTGGCFIDWLHWQNVTNPIVSLFENVDPYRRTLSFAVIKSTLQDLFGMAFSDFSMTGEEFGALENRSRLCGLAVCTSLDVQPEQHKPSSFEKTYEHKTLADALEDVSQDSDMYKPYTYLVEKQKRDIAAGKGFRLQWVNSDVTTIGTLGSGYAKSRSTEAFLKHLTKPLARLLTVKEHCRVKQIPECFSEG